MVRRCDRITDWPTCLVGRAFNTWTKVWLLCERSKNMACYERERQEWSVGDLLGHSSQHTLMEAPRLSVICGGICTWNLESRAPPTVPMGWHTTAYTHGWSSRWSFLTRTVPNICHLLGEIIRTNLLPSLTGRPPLNNTERNIFWASLQGWVESACWTHQHVTTTQESNGTPAGSDTIPFTQGISLRPYHNSFRTNGTSERIYKTVKGYNTRRLRKQQQPLYSELWI